MAGVRVYELAKDLGISSGQLMSTLKDMGVEVSSHASSLDAATADLVKEMLASEKAPAVSVKTVEIGPGVSVRELAEGLGAGPADVQRKLVELGVLASINQEIGADVAQKVAEQYGYAVKVTHKREHKEERTLRPQPKQKHGPRTIMRPPVVTIMGHIDHGKTTLLDTIRKTNVTEQEFGGITQHIGAYQVDVNGRKITFLDTPGHEAFTAMRARGASVTDIAVLVVAADDSVMPTTIEAIDHARAANVPIIVAINKIDKDNANVERTKQQLAEQDLVPEEWGGETITVSISAKQGTGIEELLEMILLVAEMAELKGEASGAVQGSIIEAKLDRGKGPVATALINKGTLKVGLPVLAGQAYGKIKAMLDDKGQRVTKAGPATPVEILGLSTVPLAGDQIISVSDEKEARLIAEARIQESRSDRMAASQRVTLEDLYRQIREGSVKDLNVILKADVQGSLEAVRQSMEQLATDEVRVRMIHTGVGAISESDILLASASNAIVMGFNVKVHPEAQRAAELEKIEVRVYQVIYELLNDVRAAMVGMLEPVFEEIELGKAEVRRIFKLPGGGKIAGCYVTEGKVLRGSEMRVRRGQEVVYTGKLDSLKHIKEDAREMAAGYECGIMADGFNDFQEGDIIESYSQKQVARAL
ncbi:MAG: translation initiation factor IF-2 [Armatimonadota bacterium]|nr:translation initiation factor IF-2 [Armatimonadota bacterium]